LQPRTVDVPKSFATAVRSVERKLSNALRGIDVCMIHNVLTMHFNLVFTAALVNIMRRQKSVRFIGWTHDLTFSDPVHEPHQHRRYPWSLLLTKAQNCDYCVISRQRQTEMRKLFRVKAASLPVIPDGISVPQQLRLTDNVRQLFYDEQLSGIDIVAITPARILRRKNLALGIEIVAALKKRGKSVKWIVTGAADAHNPESMKYYRTLRSLRRRLRIEKEVVFLCERQSSSVSNEDLRALYRISDMLLFPSDREGFGLPVLEAGLAGLLAVISDAASLRELAGSDAVYIHLGDSADEVAKKIITAIDIISEVKS